MLLWTLLMATQTDVRKTGQSTAWLACDGRNRLQLIETLRSAAASFCYCLGRQSDCSRWNHMGAAHIKEDL